MCAETALNTHDTNSTQHKIQTIKTLRTWMYPNAAKQNQ